MSFSTRFLFGMLIVGTMANGAKAKERPNSRFNEEIFSAIAIQQISQLIEDGKVDGLQFSYPVPANITQIEIKEKTPHKLRYRIETGGGWCSFEAQSSLTHGKDQDSVLTTTSTATCSG